MPNLTYNIEKFCGNQKLWDSQLTVNTSSPDLTECFQHTVLIWIPVWFLFFFTPLLLYQLITSKRLPLPWTWLNIAKLVLCVCLAMVTGALLFYSVDLWRSQSKDVPMVDFVYPLLLCISMLNFFILNVMCKAKGLTTSGVIWLSWLLFATFGVVEFVSHIRKLSDNSSPPENISKVAVYIIYYVLVLVQLVLASFADKTAQYRDVGKEHLCPEEKSSFLSQITFWWFNPLAILGWRNPITTNDLWSVNEIDSSSYLVPNWEKFWNPAVRNYHHKKAAAEDIFEQEVKAGLHPVEESAKLLEGNGEIELVSKETSDQANGDKSTTEVMLIDPKAKKKAEKKKGKKEKQPGPKLPSQPSIVWRLFLCFKWIFVPATLYKIIADTLQFASPQILRLLINFVQESKPNQPPIWIGMFYAALLLLVAIIYSLLLHQYFHLMFRAGMNIRTVLVSAVFKKSLLLSNSARKTKQVGEIVNLMSTDAQRFMDVAPYINALWSAPFQIALSLYFLWQILGPSVLAGVAVMVLLIPLNGVVASKQRALQVQQMKFKDERIKLMNEVLNGMKVLKLYAWEPPFEEEITKIRNQELKVLRRASYLNAFSSFTWICAPFLVSLVTFSTFVLVDERNILTPTVAFVSLSLFNILRFPLTMLPMMITFLVQASVSNQRLKSFLTADEIDPESVTHDQSEADPIVIRNGNFTWDKSLKTPTLTGINLSVPTGSLIAVVGQVGSGKSSLVSAILGEMDKMESGERKCVVNTKGRIAYVPQQAWVQNSTLRENITFARSYDQRHYQKVIDACALQPDLDILPGGDTTEIGEKGINLSGGQKQRVSLARAVYQDADTYLLDDPLSAVDSHVGKHIFENVISHNGLLRSKTRVLVTHGLTYLKHVDRIVVMKKGEISEIGSYEELIRNGGAFAEFLETYLTQKASHEEPDSEEDENVAELLTEIEKIAPTVRRRLESQMSTVSSAAGENNPISRQESHTSPIKSLITARSVSRSPPLSAKGKKSSPERQMSKISHKSESPEKLKKVGTTLMEAEKMETGKVKAAVYFMYVRAVGYLPAAIICLFFMSSQGFSVGTNLWLSEWSNAELTRPNSTSDDLDKWLGGYGGLGIGQALFVFLGSLLSSYAMVQASALLHKSMLHNLMRSPIAFFDVTPLGRIVNRCGKDVDVVDNTIPQNLRSWIQCVISVIATLAVIVASTPIFGVVILPLGILYYFIQRFYVATSRQLKRLESVSRSPIYSHFQETITGAPSIRAYGVQKSFVATSQQFVDNNQSCYYPNIASNRWLAIRLEFVGNCIVFFAAMFAVLARDDDVSAGVVGLSVTYALSITQTLNWAVRMTSDLETNIVAVERIKEYSETPTEAEWETPYNKPNSSWPDVGHIEFEKLEVRYRPGLDLVLKGINCSIEGGEKIGIVGRTGAGKSSLTLALFRMVEAAGGCITIDSVNVAQIGLHDLRRKLTIIPQEPVLFSGTLRLNLDPFNQYKDEQLWSVLELSHLKEFVASLPDKFEHKITEGGDNLSVGQKQLVCLARALLRKTKLLILDEATAAVDLETDDLIQKTIRSEFEGSTVLTIAHRLNTIMDSSRVLVLDKGQIVEFGSPDKLLSNRNGVFYGMAKDAGLV